MAVTILTDSAADYENDELASKNIKCVRMNITIDGKDFEDGSNLGKQEFYNYLKNCKELPKTSQPSPSQFLEIFEEEKALGNSVVAILISKELSGTIQSALLAKELCDYDDIFILNSRSVSCGIRILVNEAVKLRDKGCSAKEIYDTIKALRERVRILAGLDTLTNLFKGGRLSRSAAGLGTLTNLKPIVTTSPAGTVKVCGKHIGVNRTCRFIAEIVEKEGIDKNFEYCFLYSEDDTNCNKLMKLFISQGIIEENATSHNLGAAIGTHIGPGAYGIAFIKKEI